MPSTLTVVGLGPGNPGLRTLACQSALDAASRIVLRTSVHPGVEDVASDPRTVTCDDLYESADRFDALYPAIVARVLEHLATGDVVYAVPGSPSSGEATVPLLRKAAASAGHDVDVVPGIGALDLIAASAELDLMAESVQIVDATLLAAWVDDHPFGGWLLPVVPKRPLIVTQVYSAAMRAAAGAALSSIYPDDHPVTVVGWDTASAASSRIDTTLLELDSVAVDHLTSLVVPAVADRFASRSPFALDQVISFLRSPDGCPWDRAQSHASLLKSVVEEAFEVVDAVRSGEPGALAEELGDLLLQPVIQAQIAAEADDFDLADVFESITEKLVRRHPHVFGEETADTPDEVLSTWRRVKSTEAGRPKPGSAYDRLPRSMPPSLKVARTLPKGDAPLDPSVADDLARTVAEHLVQLIGGGHDADRLVDDACRILVDRAISASAGKG